MIIPSNITRKLLGTLFVLTTSSLHLNAMERPKMQDWEFPEYFRIWRIAHHCVGNENIFPAELTQYIFFLTRQAIMVDHIAQNCSGPRMFVNAIGYVCERFGPDLSVEIVTMGLARANKSIVDVTDQCNQTALHIAVAAKNINVEVVKVLLAVADKHGKVLELILMRDATNLRVAYIVTVEEWICKDKKILNTLAEILSMMKLYAGNIKSIF